MKKRNKILIALLTVSMGLAGLAGVAAARGGCGYGPGYGHGYGHGPGYGPGCAPGAGMNQQGMEILQKHHTAMGPLYMELQAKKQELTAKIYEGADEATIKNLVGQVNSLQDRLTESGAALHQQLVKAGVSLNAGMMNCPAIGAGFQGGRGFHGGGHGFHGGRGYQGGYGFHGHGGCPYATNAPAPNAQ